jgi:hypothetical protein
VTEHSPDLEPDTDQVPDLEPDPADAELGTVSLVPDGLDATDDLTVDELSNISRQLRCDVGAAMADQGTGAGRRWDAMALVAWTWLRRTDPKAKLTPFRKLTGQQLVVCIGWDDDDDESEGDSDDLELDPTGPALES